MNQNFGFIFSTEFEHKNENFYVSALTSTETENKKLIICF